MNDSNFKIIVKGNKVVNLEHLFKGKEESRREMAVMSFPEKIKELISLQEIALKWGGKKDIIVWNLDF